MNLMMLSDKFSIDKDTLRKDFYPPENEYHMRWFFQHLRVKKESKSKTNFINLSKESKLTSFSLNGFMHIPSEKT